MKRPNMKAFFQARIDRHVNGMLARPVGYPHNVRTVKGDVTDAVIVVVMVDGTEWQWSGGRYSTRKVNLCYAPLMPTPITASES